jgi:LPS sulfotransferase NodH
MTRRFDAFVIFAEMRTGSNHLEESLNALDDVQCHGELFNPTFIGQHNRFEFLGFDLHRRERDPVGMVDTMIDRGGTLPGFRFFHDHDARVLDRVLPDPRIAKVLLTRNPLDSYVSRKIASETGQWRLTDLKHAKSRKVTFDEREFARMLTDWTAFRSVLRRYLQVTGQAMFHIRYEDINDADILNGLAAFLGSAHRLPAASDRLKRQNPGAIEDKIANVSEMTAALGADRPVRTGSGDGRRGAAPARRFRLRGASRDEASVHAGSQVRRPRVLDWMAGIGDVGREALVSGMTQKDLRKWMRTHPGFVSFSILRHPMLRVHRCLPGAAGGGGCAGHREMREVLTQRYGVPFDGAVTVPA